MGCGYIWLYYGLWIYLVILWALDIFGYIMGFGYIWIYYGLWIYLVILWAVDIFGYIMGFGYIWLYYGLWIYLDILWAVDIFGYIMGFGYIWINYGLWIYFLFLQVKIKTVLFPLYFDVFSCRCINLTKQSNNSTTENHTKVDYILKTNGSMLRYKTLSTESCFHYTG